MNGNMHYPIICFQPSSYNLLTYTTTALNPLEPYNNNFSTGWSTDEEHELTIQVTANGDADVGYFDLYLDNQLVRSVSTYLVNSNQSLPLYFGHPDVDSAVDIINRPDLWYSQRIFSKMGIYRAFRYCW